MVGYYHQFIHHFVKLAKTLVHLLIKEVTFSWDEKKARPLMFSLELWLPPLCMHSDFEKMFDLFTNASDFAVFAILAQFSENKV